MVSAKILKKTREIALYSLDGFDLRLDFVLCLLDELLNPIVCNRSRLEILDFLAFYVTNFGNQERTRVPEELPINWLWIRDLLVLLVEDHRRRDNQEGRDHRHPNAKALHDFTSFLLFFYGSIFTRKIWWLSLFIHRTEIAHSYTRANVFGTDLVSAMPFCFSSPT